MRSPALGTNAAKALGGVLLAIAVASLSASAQEPPPIPAPPAPPAEPVVVDAFERGAGFRLPAGATHKGDVYKINATVEIEGTLEGDLTCLAGTISVPGIVTGDVFAAGSRAEITGSAGDSVRLYAGEILIDGPIHGDLIASGGTIRIGPKAVIDGDAQIYGKDVVVEGKIASDLFLRAGVFELKGAIGGDADVVVEKISLDPNARIVGDFTYGAREKLDLSNTEIVGGDVTYEGRREKSARRGEESTGAGDGSGDDFGGFGGRLFRFIAALVAYAAAIRFARHVMPYVEAAASDALQSAGVGFIAFLSAFAAIITMIGVVTIPLVILYLFLWVVAFYLSGIPPALWIGRFVLARLGRPAGSIYAALSLGLAILYLAFGIPYLGWVVWCAATLWGLGALVLGARAYWIGRKAATVRPPPPAGQPATA